MDFKGISLGLPGLERVIQHDRAWERVRRGSWTTGIIVNSDCRRYLQSRFLKSGGGSPTARKMISRNIIKRNFETIVLGDY